MPIGQPTLITYEDSTRSIRGWALHCGLPYKTLWARLANAWPLEEALQTPPRVSRHERQLPLPGLAPSIRGPAIASGGTWVALAPWQAHDATG